MVQRQKLKDLLKACLAWLTTKLKITTIGVLSRLGTLSLPPRFLTSAPHSSPKSSPSPLLLALLCLILTGCGFFNPGPPSAVVEKAVAQKLVQTQELLRSQLSNPTDASSFEIGRVKVDAKHNVTLDDRSVVEVEGTYTLKGGDLSRAQRRQQRPFEVLLQRGSEEEQWLLLEPNASGASNRQGWIAVPLS